MNSYVTGKGAAAVHKVLSKKKHWCQKKTIDIFNFKQRLLSIDMKTKVVQHVPKIKFSGFQFFKFFKFLITFLVPSTCLDFQTFLICERQTKAGEDSVRRGRGGYYAKRSNFGPPPLKKKNKATCGFWAPHPLSFWAPTQFFWAPNGFWGPQIDPTPPIKCKTLQIWPTLKWFFRFFVNFLFFSEIFFSVLMRISGPPKANFCLILGGGGMIFYPPLLSYQNKTCSEC